jgi:type I site-specific restriction endonuclease
MVRKKYVALTPEEWVRQHMINYLVHSKNTPSSLIRVESGLKVHKLFRRADIITYSNSGQPLMIIECKAPGVKISQDTFDQAAMYNITLKVPILVVSNGLTHYCCRIDFNTKKYTFLREIPDYNTILNY